MALALINFLNFTTAIIWALAKMFFALFALSRVFIFLKPAVYSAAQTAGEIYTGAAAAYKRVKEEERNESTGGP